MNNKASIYLFIITTTVLSVAGCKPEPQGVLGEPFDKTTGMIGTWQINSFTQTDLNSPVNEVRDLSTYYTDGVTTPMQITLSDDNSYSVTLEVGRNYFGNQGVWGFDDNEHPSLLILETTLPDGTPSDTLSYELGQIVRPFDNNLSIEYNRLCGSGSSASKTVLYSFNFNRVN